VASSRLFWVGQRIKADKDIDVNFSIVQSPVLSQLIQYSRYLYLLSNSSLKSCQQSTASDRTFYNMQNIIRRDEEHEGGWSDVKNKFRKAH
jgi:hypothetical protein